MPASCHGPKMRMFRRVGAVVLLGLVVCLSNGPTQAQDIVWLRFQQYLDALRRQAAIPGISAAILKDRQIVWQAGFGLADVANRVPATPATPYHVAGLTQTFSAVLLLQCAEQGVVDLDAPLGGYLPPAPEPAPDPGPVTPAVPLTATLRQLLTHTSDPGLDGSPEAFRFDLAHIAVLTPVIEACRKQPYREALAHGLLDVAGLWQSVPGQDVEDPIVDAGLPLEAFDLATRARYLDVLSRLATPYRVDGRGRPVASEYTAKTLDAAGGLVSTATDLALFDVALTPWTDETLGEPQWMLLSPPTLQMAWSPPAAPAPVTSGPSAVTTNPRPHGLGWFVQDYEGERLVWQYGVLPGASSALVLKSPARGLTMVLLANSDGLVAPYGLETGDVTTSPFARLFLRLFL